MNNDLIRTNAALNSYESSHGKTILTSTPQYVTIGTHYRCNADCVFCLGGDYPHFTLAIYKDLFEKKMGHVLRNANHVGFCGFGETLLMPGIEEFLDHLNATLPDNDKAFTTNGIALTDGVCQRLTDGKYSLMISLHASHRALHEQITRTKAFDTIIERLGKLVALKKRKGTSPSINLVFLLTRLNTHDLPAFVEKAKSWGADCVTCNYINIYEPEQLRLSSFFDQQAANEAIDRACEAAKRLDISFNHPPKFMPHEKKQGGPACSNPWDFFYVETQGSVNPCCFAGNHIGYLTTDDFETIWNGAGYTRLREGLVNGNIHTWCRLCYNFDRNNVNDIRSHITFRPETQKKILEYLRAHRDEFPLPDSMLCV